MDMAGESYNRYTNSSLCIWLSAFIFVANLLRKEFGAILFLSSVLCVLFGCFSVYPTFVAEGYYWFYFVCALRCFQFIFVFPKAATAAVPIVVVVVAATDAG